MLRTLLAALLLCFTMSTGALAATDSDKATQEIEGLLTYVGQLKGATFIRNGSSYDASTAVSHMRLKWRNQTKCIHTAEDFIQRCGTESSMSGKPYLIRFSDGTEKPCAEVLKDELARLRKPPAKETEPVKP